MFRRAVLSLCLLAGLAAAPLRLPAAAPDAIQAMYDAGKYRQVLRETAIVTHLSDAAKFGYDLHDIWLLKAEAHLRLKQQVLSAEAFESASKVAPDAATADLDHATGLAVGESKAGLYIPADQRENARAKGFSVIDPAGRPQALEALFEDRLASAEEKLDPLEKEGTLKKIINAGDTLTELRRLERAAGPAVPPASAPASRPAAGASDRTDAIAKKLAIRADELIGDPLVKESDQVEQIARNAAQTQNVQVNVADPAHPGKTMPQQQDVKKGLTSADLQLLTGVQADCRNIVAACSASATRLGVDPGIFDTTTTAASLLAARAAAIANAP